MKSILLCAGILFTIAAHAGLVNRATLTGQHLSATGSGSVLICEYSGTHARFEILSQRGSCAPFIDVE